MSLKNRWDSFWSNALESSTEWETVSPNLNLINYISKNNPKNVLEIGCGAHVINANWVAEYGISTTAIDISDVAIKYAIETNSNPLLNIRVHDMLENSISDKYDFVFDYGCFHSLNFQDDRNLFVKKISECLSDGGTWMSIVGSTEGIHPTPNFGPPRRSVMDLAISIEPCLEIVSINQTYISMKNDLKAPAWEVISRKRIVPATIWIPKSSTNLSNQSN